MVRFEGYERRIDGINKAMAKYDIASLEDAKAICDAKGVDVAGIVKGVQPIAFERDIITRITNLDTKIITCITHFEFDCSATRNEFYSVIN